MTREEREKVMLKEIDNFEIPELSENLKQKILNALQDEHSNNFNEFCEWWEDSLFGEFDEKLMPVETNKKGGEEKITEQRAREIMKEIVKEFFNYTCNSREVGQFEFQGYTLLLSGGMSYGDNPTDAMDSFNKINNIPIKIREAGGLE